MKTKRGRIKGGESGKGRVGNYLVLCWGNYFYFSFWNASTREIVFAPVGVEGHALRWSLDYQPPEVAALVDNAAHVGYRVAWKNSKELAIESGTGAIKE